MFTRPLHSAIAQFPCHDHPLDVARILSAAMAGVELNLWRGRHFPTALKTFSVFTGLAIPRMRKVFA
jgi:hypothetical protein